MLRHLPALLVAAFLVGCASSGQPVRSPGAAASPRAKPAVAAAERPAALPEQALTRDILFKLLVAEVAGQRGEVRLAAEAYADLARSTRDPRVAKRATEAAMYSQNGQMALEVSRIWAETEPTSEQAVQTYASMLVSGGEFDQAAPVLADIIAKQGPKTGAALLQIGSMLNRSGDRSGAFELATRLAAPYAGMAEANLMLAQMALNAGREDVALQKAELAVRQRPEWEPGILFVAQLQASHDAVAATRYLAAARKRLPGSRGVGLAYARALTVEGNYQLALQEFKRLAKAFPKDGELSVSVGALASQAGDMNTAAEYLRRALESDYAEKDQIRLMLGQLEAERGNAEQALQWLDSVGPSASFMPSRIAAARVVLKRDGLAAARQRIHSIHTAGPAEDAQVLLAEAQLVRESGDDQGAFNMLDEGVKEYAGLADVWYDHAMAAERLDRIDVMETSLRRVIELQPDHAHAYNALGFSLADRNVRLIEAKGYIEQALQFAPEDPYIIDSLGWVQYRLGELDDSERTLRRALGIRQDPEIVAHLSEVLAKRGKADEARHLLEVSLRRNPDNATLLAVQARLFP